MFTGRTDNFCIVRESKTFLSENKMMTTNSKHFLLLTHLTRTYPITLILLLLLTFCFYRFWSKNITISPQFKLLSMHNYKSFYKNPNLLFFKKVILMLLLQQTFSVIVEIGLKLKQSNFGNKAN